MRKVVILKDSVGVLDGNPGKFTRVEGKIGQAIEFDGSSGYAWSEPIASSWIQKNARSISFWIWLNAHQPSPNTGAYGHGQNSVSMARTGFGNWCWSVQLQFIRKSTLWLEFLLIS